MSLTYTEFLTKNIDLASLGIEHCPHFTPYFCTPKGATVIGSAGVDGIHFCFLEDFGEMVFAISPCNGIGEYVHPIARTFEDFLSLLVSCADAAALEQAWQWNKKQFYAFLQENQCSQKAEQTMRTLERDLSIPFMEEPFDYLKALQAEFDYTKIQFTEEYYDVVGDEPPVKEAQAWEVYFNSGFWKSSVNPSLPGTELTLNAVFPWGNEIWHIPAMYLCEQGFVIDYCVEIAPEKVRVFLEKWESVRQNENAISPDLHRQIERENPLETNVRSHFLLNGNVVREKSGSRLSYIPKQSLPADVENPPETLAIMKHYNLDTEKAWSFQRHSCPWITPQKPEEPRSFSVPLKPEDIQSRSVPTNPKDAQSSSVRLEPQDIHSFSVRLERHPETIPGIHFKNPAVGDVIRFTHPISGTEHKLTVLTYEQQEFSMDHLLRDGYEFPTHHTAMTYTLEPPLPGTAFRVSDCLPSEEARPIPKKVSEPQMTEAASIGIIGGADGPTAIIMSSKAQPGGILAALSALHFEPVADIEWKIEFREKMRKDVEITLI